jgi:UDP-N-acetylglucosamine--N-acetylmuramyl-(pentapeptide) pyrophosphoryl-undecaprenol N-acetylglucosamine transferase
MSTEKKNILIVGGGTGGHISPGIALCEYCAANGIDAYLLVGTVDAKFNYLKEVDDAHRLFYSAPPFTKNPFKLPVFLLRFFMAASAAKRIIRKHKIDCIVGMGGYVSAPALWAAHSMKKPLYLCEQNTVPGKVTLLFAKKAKAILTTFDDTRRFVKTAFAEKCICVGNPVRGKVLVDVDKKKAQAFFNLEHCDKVILAIGGSQGARAINELVLGMKRAYPDEFSRIGVIWCTGAASYEKYRTIIREDQGLGSLFISPFVEDVGLAYRASDIAISRSGAGVMMELAAMSVPSILIPYPFAASDHQNKNADVFARSGASLKIDNKDASPEKVGPMILDILSSSQKLRVMSEKSKAEAKIDASERIIKAVTE